MYSFLGQIRLGADPEQGHNTSMRGPFYKELLLQSGMLQQQTECIAIIYKHLGVLMTPAHLYWLLGESRTVVDAGHGHNRSIRALLQKTTSSELKGHSNKPNIHQWSNSIWEEVLLFSFCSILMSSFWHFLMLHCIGLGHFHLF